MESQRRGARPIHEGSNSGADLAWICLSHVRLDAVVFVSSDPGKKGFRLLALATVTASSVQHASASDCPCASRFTSNSPVPETGPKP